MVLPCFWADDISSGDEASVVIFGNSWQLPIQATKRSFKMMYALYVGLK